jgi:GTP-binding protein
MRFIDETRVFVAGGHGGRGCVAFLREKFRPNGGPAGGDGGKGASVVLVATSRASTLLDLHFVRHYKAPRGTHGGGKKCHGANGKDIEIMVPLGTVIFDDETGTVLGDLTNEDERLIVAKGGRGGQGNARFATSVRKAPDWAQPGEPGEERWIRLELKLLADVGLIGLPNAGKSTLIRKMSRSQAKVAEYPFTTLVPNLGVVPYGDYQSFVIADVPGLIAGASDGAGLGHQFLRHIERTRVLVHLLDCMGESDPVEAHNVLMDELKSYEPELAKRPRIVCLSKCDLADSEWIDLCRTELTAAGCHDVISLSGVSGTGTDTLRHRIVSVLEKHPNDLH